MENRARQLVAQLPAGGELVLIAHSMGGLDARYAVSRLGLASRVRTVLSVSTPHRGSPFADFCRDHLQRQIGLYAMLERAGIDVGSGRDLTTDAAAAFNRGTPDAPGVRYLAVTSGAPVDSLSFPLRSAGRIIEAAEGANDGLVSAASSAWGETIDHWPLDHLATIGKAPPGTAARDDAARLGRRWVEVVRRACGGS